MQRFRMLEIYVAGMLLFLATTIAGMAWLQRPPVAMAGADVAPARPAEPSTPATTQPAGRIDVLISDFAFVPRELSVTVGPTVTWVNRDDVPHTATSSDGPAAFDSRALDTNDRFSFTFTTPGAYRYYCKAHPHMMGTVVVK